MAACPSPNSIPLEMLRHGQAVATPAFRELRCGPLEVAFDPALGWVRRVRVAGREAVRAVYGAVRDKDWATVPTRVDRLQVEEGEETFRVSFDVLCEAPGIGFRWAGEIIGAASGTLTFRFAGEALTGFWRNRIGLCVLHPLEACAGQRCQVETAEGTVVDAASPRLIAPQQPFERVRAITHEVVPDVRVEVRFAGEVFETEDQRNWTDASFKTYSTPLVEPFPAWIAAGTRVEQSVTVRVIGAPVKTPARHETAEIPELHLTGDAARPLPSIGFSLPPDTGALTAAEAVRLRQLRPTHLRVDLHLRLAAWPARWRRAVVDAAAVGTTLHVALFLSDGAELELAALAVELSAQPGPVALWLVFHENEPVTRARWVRMAEAALPAGALFAAGTNANFAELNRARPDPAMTALPCYSLHPQAHAFDDASLIENLGGQADTVATARQFAAPPVVISPITLRPYSQSIDPRQMSLFGAAWTVGSLARLAVAEGVHSLTYFETTGGRGVMEAAAGSPLPKLFPSLPGGVFPMFHVFATVAEGTSVLATRSTDPLCFEGFCLIGRDGRHRWGVANLTATPRRVHVVTGGADAHVRMLDETNAERAMREPESFAGGQAQPTPDGRLTLELSAYAFAQITVGG